MPPHTPRLPPFLCSLLLHFSPRHPSLLYPVTQPYSRFLPPGSSLHLSLARSSLWGTREGRGGMYLGNYTHYTTILNEARIKEDLDKYVLTSKLPFVFDICNKLMMGSSVPQMNEGNTGRVARGFHLRYLGAIVLYITDILTGRVKDMVLSTRQALAFYRKLCLQLDICNREKLMSCIIDELRHASPVTYFYGQVVLDIYQKTGEGVQHGNASHGTFIQEQLVGVLMERAMTPPLPWGIAFVINELIHNPEYALDTKPYILSCPQVIQFIHTIKSNFTNMVPQNGGNLLIINDSSLIQQAPRARGGGLGTSVDPIVID